MAMSPEELKELEELEELAILEEQEQQQIAAAQVEPSTVEALSTGFVEGVPFMKDAIAGVEAIQERANSENPLDIDAFVDQYKENMDDINRTINLSEELAPGATFAGDVIGGASTLSLGAGMKGAAAVGAASGLSRSEDREASDALVGAATGMVGEKVGQVVGKGFKKVGGLIQDKADEALRYALGADKAFGSSRIHKHLKISKQTGDEFLSSIKELGIVDAGDAPQNILDKASRVKSELGKRIGSFYKQVDDELAPEVNINEVKQRIADDVLLDFQMSDDPGMQEIGAELAQYVEKIGKKSGKINKVLKPSGQLDKAGNPIMVEEVSEEILDDSMWSMSRLHNLQKDIRSRISSIYKRNGMDMTASKEQQRKVAATIGNVMDETLDEISTPDNLVYQINKDLRRQYGNASTIEEILDNKVSKLRDDPLQEIKEAFNFRSLAVTGAASAAFGPVGGALAFVANKAINSPKTPSYIAKGLPHIANAVSSNPTGKIAKRLLTASAMASDRFEKAMSGSIAELNLTLSPIPRNVEGAKDKYDDIENLLELHLPTLAKQFRDVRASGDDNAMAQLLDQLSKDEEGNKLFEPGQGIDGRVFTPEDKAELENQLRNQSLPSTERMRLLKELRSNGTIPNVESVPQRVPNRYVPRRKDDIDY